jgi:hypothetical protein
MILVQGEDPRRAAAAYAGPLTTNQAYTFHVYTFLFDDRPKLLASWAALARKHNVPLWVGEFGEDKADALRSTVALLDDPAHLVTGWCFWTWKKVPNKYPHLVAFKIPATWEAVMSWLAGGVVRAQAVARGGDRGREGLPLGRRVRPVRAGLSDERDPAGVVRERAGGALVAAAEFSPRPLPVALHGVRAGVPDGRNLGNQSGGEDWFITR